MNLNAGKLITMLCLLIGSTVVFEIVAQTQMKFPVDDFMGINLKREDPPARLGCVGFVREYHEWVLDEGISHLGCNSIYPNNKYKWNPSHHGQVALPFDDFYQQMVDEGVTLCADLMMSAPYVIDPYHKYSVGQIFSQAHKLLDQKPIPQDWSGRLLRNSFSPFSYREHALWLYHFSARYGSRDFGSTLDSKIIYPRLHEDDHAFGKPSGKGLIKYVESWNEQDKNWYMSEYPHTYFRPFEYAAMLSADYDGHMDAITEPVPGSGYNHISGVKNADPDMKLVMGGLAGLKLCYVDSMLTWFEENRKKAGFPTYPLDVINFHHYSNDYNNSLNCKLNQLAVSNVGWSPERDSLRIQLTNLKNNIFTLHPALPTSTEFWLSEFGYDTNPYSPQRVPVITGNGSTSDRQEVQGQWLVRSFLETAAAGWDRAMIYGYADVTSDNIYVDFTPNDGIYNPTLSEIPWHYLYKSCGLLMDKHHNFQPKKSWYYVYTMKNVLTNMKFVEDRTVSLPNDPYDPFDGAQSNYDNIRIYRFVDTDDNNHQVLAVWCPSEGNRSVNNYPVSLNNLTTGSNPVYIKMQIPDTDGKVEPLNINNGYAWVPVSERPIFIELGGNRVVKSQEKPLSLKFEEATCSSVALSWTEMPGTDHYVVYYADPINGDLTLDKLGNLSNLTLVNDAHPSNGIGQKQECTVSNLAPSTHYGFVVIAVDDENNYSEPVYLNASTNQSTCQIPTSAFNVIDDFPQYNFLAPNKLFDEQDKAPICTNGSTPSSEWGQYWANGTGANEISCKIEFNKPHNIDGVILHDGAGQPYNYFFKIQYEDLNQPGNWITALEYEPIEYNKWVSFFGLDIPQGVKRLRIVKPHAQAAINEVVLCGEETFGAVNTCPLETTVVSTTCNSARLAFQVEGGCTVNNYRININSGNSNNTLWTSNDQFTISNLDFNRVYNFTVQYQDETGSFYPENPVIQTFTTKPENDPSCSDCGCEVLQLTPEMVHYENSPQIFNNGPLRLIDEQSASGDPFCGVPGTPVSQWLEPWSFTQAYIDLGENYIIDGIALFDGAGIGHFGITAGEPGAWANEIVNYQTNLYNKWVVLDDLDNLNTRYLLLSKKNAGAKINEIKVCVRTPGGGDRGKIVPPVEEQSLLIYPNPTTDRVKLFAPKSGYSKLEIYDVNARLRFQTEVSEFQQYFEVDMSDFEQGTFFIRLKSDDRVISGKVVKVER